MRMAYDPSDGTLSFYVRQDEFDFAGTTDSNEYRVFSRTFSIKSLEEFIQSYTNFIKELFGYLLPQEKVHDIITISTYKSSYAWRSLLDLNNTDDSVLFLENMLSYALATIDKEIKSKNPDKSITDSISRKDASKLSLISQLLDLNSLPQPYQKTKRKNKSPKVIQNRIDLLKEQINTFETQFGFDSKQLVKYYSNDKFLSDEFKSWFNVINELDFINSIKNREQLAEELITLWQNKL